MEATKDGSYIYNGMQMQCKDCFGPYQKQLFSQQICTLYVYPSHLTENGQIFSEGFAKDYKQTGNWRDLWLGNVFPRGGFLSSVPLICQIKTRQPRVHSEWLHSHGWSCMIELEESFRTNYFTAYEREKKWIRKWWSSSLNERERRHVRIVWGLESVKGLKNKAGKLPASFFQGKIFQRKGKAGLPPRKNKLYPLRF